MSNFTLSVSGFALAAWVLKATALLIAALAATSVLRRASAGARHLVWLATLAGVLVIPAVATWAPLRLAVLPQRLVPGNLARREASTVAPATLEAAAPVSAAAPSREGIATPSPLATDGPAGPIPAMSQISARAAFLAVWALVALGLFTWLALGALSVRRIVRRARPFSDARWSSLLCDISDRLDLDAMPRLLASSEVEMPFACGVLRPTVVLPESADEWDDDRRRTVLFHELAHIRRRDLFGHTLARVACALYWFHPLVWTAARRLRAESERACDDLVLSCGARASDYADHLLDLVVSVRRHAAPATVLPMARRRELEGRVLAILDPAVRRAGPGRLQSAGLVCGLVALALSVAAMAPAPKASPREAAPIAAQSKSSVLDTARSPRLGDDVRPRTTPGTTLRTEQHTSTSTARHAEEQRTERVAEQKVEQTANPAPAARPAPAATPEPAANAVVATRSDSERVELLARLLRSDPDASVRRTAAWGLDDHHDMRRAAEALTLALRRDESVEVREMAAWALAGSSREEALDALATALRRDASDQVRETAAWALAESGSASIADALEGALSDSSDKVRETAAWGLGELDHASASPRLITALKDRSRAVRLSAAWALGQIEDQDARQPLADAYMRETDQDVKQAELRALAAIGDPPRAVVEAAIASTDPKVRARAVRALAGAGNDPWPWPRPRPRPSP